MGQRYVRSVSASGGLSIPTVEAENVAASDDYADSTYTYAVSGRVVITVMNGPAELQVYNGSSWSTGDVPLIEGQENTYDSNHMGVRVRNAGARVAPVATVTIVRYTT